MTTLTEATHTGSFVISASYNLSVDDVVIAAGAGLLPPGAVLGQITSSGKYVPCDAAATDGSQAAVAILFEAVDATAADAPAVVIDRHAEVYAAGLVWKSTMDSGAQATALAQLAARLIPAR